MSQLKRLCPELARACARAVHARHQREAVRETAELRDVIAELLRRGRSPQDLMDALLTGDPTKVALTTAQTTT